MIFAIPSPTIHCNGQILLSSHRSLLPVLVGGLLRRERSYRMGGLFQSKSAWLDDECHSDPKCYVVITID